jgi:lysophospholipase L1-like esterase
MNKHLSSIRNTIAKNEKYRIVFYGDSVASAEWVHPNYQDIIEYVLKSSLENPNDSQNLAWWNTNFINAALDGATTQDYIERLQVDVLDYNPNLVIMFSNDNDVDKISEAEHAKNMDIILSKLTNNVNHVIYSNSIRTLNDHQNKRYSEYNAATKAILHKHKEVLFVDMFEYFSTLQLKSFFTFELHGQDSFLTDGKGGTFDAFHPNQLGNAYIAKKFLKDIFGIKFDPEKYINEHQNGEKSPGFVP